MRPLFILSPRLHMHPFALQPEIFGRITEGESVMNIQAEGDPAPKLLDRVRAALRTRHYSLPHREIVRPLDRPVRPLPRNTSSRGNGRGRGHLVSEPPGRVRPGVILHPEPGPVRRRLPLQTCAEQGSRRLSGNLCGPRGPSVYPWF